MQDIVGTHNSEKKSTVSLTKAVISYVSVKWFAVLDKKWKGQKILGNNKKNIFLPKSLEIRSVPKLPFVLLEIFFYLVLK